MAKEAILLANELQSELSSLRIEPYTGRWKSFGHAFRVSGRSEKLEKLLQRLLQLRDQLEAQVLVRMREDVKFLQASQTEGFAQMDTSIQCIGHDILAGQRLFEVALEDGLKRLMDSYQSERELAAIRHNEILLELRSTGPAGPIAAASSLKAPVAATVEKVRLSKKPKAENVLLQKLHFDQIDQREKEVEKAHDRTFTWLFEDHTENVEDVTGSVASNAPNGLPNTVATSSNRFVQWLRTGNGLFWVNGKAASGKSTLLKYLSNQPDLQRHLKAWTGTDKLYCASFYFWNAGTDLQKSQEGLLRGILHSLLTQNRQFISHCFPELINRALKVYIKAGDAPQVRQPELEELQSGLLRLSDSGIGDSKICLIVDGVDEYRGDVDKLCDLFKKASHSTKLKVIVSSRPTPVCIEAFQTYPCFQLQDLTKSDISVFVHDMLGNHSRMQQMQSQNPVEVEQLVQEVCERASGVFLWVILVTRSLLSGLSSFDTIQDLRTRLDTFPPELHGLYKHMLMSMDQFHRSQASKLLQIVYHRLMLKHGRPLTTFQLHLDEQPPRDALRSKQEEIKDRDKLRICREMQGRIRSRCCGLVEVIPTREMHRYGDNILNIARVGFSQWDQRDLIDSQIQFLHKTVVDFLAEPDIWGFVLGLCDDTTFEADVSITASSVRAIKMSPVGCEYSVIEAHMQDCLYYAQRAESTTGKAPTLYLLELDRSMTTRRERWTGAVKYTGRTVAHEESFMALAVGFGLKLFVRDMLRATPKGKLHGALGQQLLTQVILSIIQKDRPAYLNKLFILKELLGRVPDTKRVWEMTLGYVAANVRFMGVPEAEIWSQVVQSFAQAKVDVNNPPVSRHGRGLTLKAAIEVDIADDFEDGAVDREAYDDGFVRVVRKACQHQACVGWVACLRPTYPLEDLKKIWQQMCTGIAQYGAVSAEFDYESHVNSEMKIRSLVQRSAQEPAQDEGTTPAPSISITVTADAGQVCNVDQSASSRSRSAPEHTSRTASTSQVDVSTENGATLLPVTSSSPRPSSRSRSISRAFSNLWHRRSASTNSSR